MANFSAKLLPVMRIATFIGVLAGLAIAGLGVARMMGSIDMGRSFEEIQPTWMIGGGLLLIVVFIFKFQRFKKKVKLINESTPNE